MGDPELVARAQRAAERLERSWDQWRRLHGLAAEQAQPVSSYVGYSLAEPWGRPRVVFGVGAEEAERLSALLEQDAGDDPRFSQGLLWEPGAPEPTEPGRNGTRPSVNVADAAQFPASPGAGQVVPPSSGNGQATPNGPGSGQVTPTGSGNGHVVPPSPDSGQVSPNGDQLPGDGGQPAEPQIPEARQGEQEPETESAKEWAKSMPTFQPPTVDGASAGDRGVPAFQPAPTVDGAGARGGGQATRAELAGWTSGELPGQASAGLAAWRSAGTSPADGAERGQAGPERGTREASPRAPEASAGSPDPTAWLRLALLGPEPPGAVGSAHAER